MSDLPAVSAVVTIIEDQNPGPCRIDITVDRPINGFYGCVLVPVLPYRIDEEASILSFVRDVVFKRLKQEIGPAAMKFKSKDFSVEISVEHSIV